VQGQTPLPASLLQETSLGYLSFILAVAVVVFVVVVSGMRAVWLASFLVSFTCGECSHFLFFVICVAVDVFALFLFCIILFY